MKDLDKAVSNILLLIQRTSPINKGAEFNKEEHHDLSCEIATDGAVLLKNEGSLPLAKNQKYLIIGELFDKMRFQGAGSSLVNPTKLISSKTAFDARQINYEFVLGYRESEIDPEEAYENEAINMAKNYDTILFFGGQTDYTESEGYDRDTLALPSNQLSLLTKLRKMKKKIIFVMFGGSPVEMPFEKDMDAILNMYLPGQAGGEATAKLLFGEVSPSGKLAETWMETYKDVPFGDEFISNKVELYKESIYVGYRYFDKLKGKGVKYPFGYGLSYTQFHYSDIAHYEKDNTIYVSCTIANIGVHEGAEIVQLYVANPTSDVFKPDKELRAFAKVYLKPGETKRIEMSFTKQDLAYYHIKEKKWVLENGEYSVLVAASSEDIRLQSAYIIEGVEPISSPYSSEILPCYYNAEILRDVKIEEFEQLLGRQIPSLNNGSQKYSLDSRLDELQNSFIGRIFYKSVVGVGKKQFNRSKRMEEGPERDMERKNGMFLMKMLPNNSIRSITVSSSGRFNYRVAEGLIEIINGNLFRGLMHMFKKDKLPALPKDNK
mgnify:CR=1 FL=1